jgi:hypothetical protein
MTEDFVKEISTAQLLDLMVKSIDEYLLLCKEGNMEEGRASKGHELFIFHKVLT